MISAPLFVIMGVVLYGYARRYGGASRTLWGGWQAPPRWARVVFGAKNNQILVNDLAIESTGIIWTIIGLVLVAVDSRPGSATFTIATGILTVVLLVGGFITMAVFAARELWHRS